MGRVTSFAVMITFFLSMTLPSVSPQLAEFYWVITIEADGTVVPSLAPIQRDGHKYTLTDSIYGKIVVKRSHIVIDGAWHTLQGQGPYQDLGFDVNFMTNVTITNANIRDVGVGFFLNSTSDSIVHANNMTNVGQGFWLGWASGNTLSENTMANISWGFDIRASWDNMLRGNFISDSTTAMILFDGCWNNTICENTIANTSFIPMELTNSISNRIYHNNLLNNTQIHLEASENSWDNGCQGNYWSDYEARHPSASYDLWGIGQTPYTLDSNNTDHYPLRNPYWSPADVNHDLKVDIYDAVLACGAYLSTPSDPAWDPHCDVAEPYGVIDIYDVIVICDNYGARAP